MGRGITATNIGWIDRTLPLSQITLTRVWPDVNDGHLGRRFLFYVLPRQTVTAGHGVRLLARVGQHADGCSLQFKKLSRLLSHESLPSHHHTLTESHYRKVQFSVDMYLFFIVISWFSKFKLQGCHFFFSYRCQRDLNLLSISLNGSVFGSGRT